MKKLSQICKDYWRQIIVAFSLIALSLALSNCKKKNTTIEPPPPTPKVCETGKVVFAGQYKNLSFPESKGGFTIELLHNNCPDTNSNTYLISGFGAAVESYSLVNQPLFTQSTYTLSSIESISLAVNSPEKITLTLSSKVLTVKSTRLKYEIKYIVK